MGDELKKKEMKAVNPYAQFRPSDSAFLNKIDSQLTKFSKDNKKYPLEFYENAKAFVMNVINLRHTTNAKEFDDLPKVLVDLTNDRNIDKLFQGYLNDTKAVGKVLFSEDMTIDEVCACAMEYVRLCSSSLSTYESEVPQGDISKLATSYAKSYNGVLSFYLGIGNEEDRSQLLARLINVGIDIIKNISYAESILNSYGDALCQVIEFKGKPMLSIMAYTGDAKTYAKNVGKYSSYYQFLQFDEHIEMARNRALKTLTKFHNFNSFVPSTNNVEKLIGQVCEIASKKISNVTATEQNVFINVDKKIFKLNTILEVLFYDKKIEYEILPDVFNTSLICYKLKVKDYSRFKLFPNKIVDDKFKLTEQTNYVVARRNVEFDENLDTNNVGDSGATEDFASKLEEQDALNDLASASGEIVDGIDYDAIDNISPVPAGEVLNKLQTKFMAPEDSDFSIDGTRFNLSESQVNSAMEISPSIMEDAKEIDNSKAEEERKMFEKELGISLPTTFDSTKPKKKSFLDMMEEIADDISKNRAKKLQEKYNEFEQKGELNHGNTYSIDNHARDKAEVKLDNPTPNTQNIDNIVNTHSSVNNYSSPVDKDTQSAYEKLDAHEENIDKQKSNYAYDTYENVDTQEVDSDYETLDNEESTLADEYEDLSNVIDPSIDTEDDEEISGQISNEILPLRYVDKVRNDDNIDDEKYIDKLIVDSGTDNTKTNTIEESHNNFDYDNENIVDNRLDNTNSEDNQNKIINDDSSIDNDIVSNKAEDNIIVNEINSTDKISEEDKNRNLQIENSTANTQKSSIITENNSMPTENSSVDTQNTQLSTQKTQSASQNKLPKGVPKLPPRIPKLPKRKI